jgi:hypothetical protein
MKLKKILAIKQASSRKCSYLSILLGCILPITQAHGQAPVTRGETSARDGWVTVAPAEFEGAINNPLKGFRDYKEQGYGLLKRTYINWNDIEVGAEDTVDRIIAHTNKITEINGKRFEDLNVKLVPRVFLDWNGTAGRQYWPTDLHTFDYDSPAFQERLKRLIAKLGEAWDNDPRIFAVQMGLIGYWGEHHSPAPTADQKRLLTEAFQKAFKNKPVLVRHTDAEFMQAGFGIYYDTFGNLGREQSKGNESQFPWQATHVYPDIWKKAPIEGEVEYNWQTNRASTSKPLETYGYKPNETMKVPAYRRYMIDKIRRYQTSYLGWISSYDDSDPEVVAGAAELQKSFGYRFVLESASYPETLKPGKDLPIKLSVRNTGSAPFYLDWPVGVALLDPATKKPIWSTPLRGVDIRKWLPGEKWDSRAFAYTRPAVSYHEQGQATIPDDIKPGEYIVALALLDREGGLQPSARFAIENYFCGGWHPLGIIGIGETPKEGALKDIKFDSPAFDNSLHYKVPERLLTVKTPPLPPVNAVVPWTPDPNIELINPWRYWTLEGQPKALKKENHVNDRSKAGVTDQRFIRVTGDFGRGSSLRYSLGKGIKLECGSYRLAFNVRGTPGQVVAFEIADSVDFATADGPSVIAKKDSIPLTDQWQEHSLTFEIGTPLKNQAFLRFQFPNEATGTFDLTNTRLKKVK